MSSAAQTSRHPAGEHTLAIARGLLATLDLERAQESARRFLELPDAGVGALREGLKELIEASTQAVMIACPECRKQRPPRGKCPTCGSKVPVRGHQPFRGIQFSRGAPLGPPVAPRPAQVQVSLGDQGATVIDQADTTSDFPLDLGDAPTRPVRVKTKRRKAKKSKKEKTMGLEEARVTGDPPIANSPSSQTGPEAAQTDPWGGPNAGVLTPAAIAAGLRMTKPPNLRKAEDWPACGNCVFFNRAQCNLYGVNRPPVDIVHTGGYPVKHDDVCDSHLTVTPPDEQKLERAQRYTDRYLREGRELAEAAAEGNGFALTRARARLDVAARHLDELGVDIEEFWSDAARAAAALARRQHSGGGVHAETLSAVSKLKPNKMHNVARGVNIRRDESGFTVLHHGSPVHRGTAETAVAHAHGLASTDTRRSSLGVHRDESIAQRRRPRYAMQQSEERDGMGNDLSEVKSDVYPGLDRSPKKNWVDKAGGLPRYIERIAKHLHYEKGRPIGTAIAIAVNVVKKMCASGDVNFPGKQNVNPKSRAEACAAVAEWERKKGATSPKGHAENAARVAESEPQRRFARTLALAEATYKPIPPSWNFVESVLGEIAEADGPGWFEGLAELDEAQAIIDEVGLKEAVEQELVEMSVLERLGHKFDAARHPRTRGGRFRDVLGSLERDMKGNKGGRIGSFRRGRGVTAKPVKRGAEMPDHIDEHLRNGRLAISKEFRLGAMPTRMQVRKDDAGDGHTHELLDDRGRKVATGQRGSVGLLWAANHAAMHAGDDDPTALTAREKSAMGRGGRRTRVADMPVARGATRVPRGARYRPPSPNGADEGQSRIGGTSSASVKTVEQHFADTRGIRPLRADPLGRSLQDRFGQSNASARLRGTPQQSSGSSPHDALKVDQAIGQVLASYPNVTDWNLDGPKGPEGNRHWHLNVELDTGKKYRIRVGEDGTVTDASKPSPPAKTAPKQKPIKTGVPTPSPYTMPPKPPSTSGYEPTGDYNVVSHMAPGTVFKGNDGHLYKLHGDEWMQGKKGKVKAAHIENLSTGTHKNVPYFTIHGTEYAVHAPKGTFTPKPASEPTSASAAFADLLKSVEGQHGSIGSVSGKNVVITGKLPDHTRDEAAALINAAGGTFQKSITSSTHVLVTGDGVGQTKINAAKKKGVMVIPWGEFKSLVESGLSTDETKLVRARARLAEATDTLEATRLRARIAVLEERVYNADERRKYATVGDDSYPIGDAEHAEQALVRLHQGNLSSAEKAKVIAKAARYLPKGHGLLSRRRSEVKDA